MIELVELVRDHCSVGKPKVTKMETNRYFSKFLKDVINLKKFTIKWIFVKVSLYIIHITYILSEKKIMANE